MNILSLTNTQLGTRGVSSGLLGGLAPVPTLRVLVCLAGVVLTGAMCAGQVVGDPATLAGRVSTGARVVGATPCTPLLLGDVRTGGRVVAFARTGACAAGDVLASQVQLAGAVRVGAQCTGVLIAWGGSVNASVRAGASIAGEVSTGGAVVGGIDPPSCDC